MRICLTGGIATGKSSILDYYKEHTECAIFDADNEVSNLYQTSEIKDEICNYFGMKAYDMHGRVDKAYLRARMLTDDLAKGFLENLFHPLVREKFMFMSKELMRGESLISEIPLYYESESSYDFDFIVVVACSRETQISRLQERSGLDRNEALAIIERQLCLSEKMLRADFVLWNEGNKSQIIYQARSLADHLNL